MLGSRASSTKPFVDAPLIFAQPSTRDWPSTHLVSCDGTNQIFQSSPPPTNITTISSRAPTSSTPPSPSPRSRQLQLRLRAPPSAEIETETRASSPTPTPTSSSASVSAAASLSRSAPCSTPAREGQIAAAAAIFISLQRGRLDDGCAESVFPTDPQPSRVLPSSTEPASLNALDAPTNPRLQTLFQQPKHPGASTPSPDLTSTINVAAAAAAAVASSSAVPAARHHHHPRRSSSKRSALPPGSFLHSPFRTRGGPSRRRRLSASRLWNPANSTPRPRPHPSHSSRKRRTSTPPPPAVPLQHPALDSTNDASDPVGTRAIDYPLLTLPEQRQTRHSASTRASLQIESRTSTDNRISLPKSVRASYDEKRPQTLTPPVLESEAGPSTNTIQEGSFREFSRKLDKGKGKAVMTSHDEDPKRSFSKDLERGPAVMGPRISNVSAGDGIGSALSSTNSSIMGEDVQPDAAGEWGPQHPCYPHLNPHVPIDSTEYITTRIIRIRRDWLLQGDLAPTFSNLYPEILDPAGLPEQEFRRIIEKLNGELIPAFSPYSFRNILDAFLGLITGWLWDDFGMTAIKARLNALEQWIEKWNMEMEKTMRSEDGSPAPKLIPLRRTGYMSLDIQIPDPEIAPAPSTNAGDSRTALPLEPGPALTTLS